MKFQNLIALIAILGFAAQAGATDGTLRRNVTSQVAQNESDQSQPQVIVIPNTGNQTTTIQTQPAAQPQAVQQPATIVEAAPVTESKAEGLRKARQNEEVHTEQKIVEKLEESRLKEEQQRADRLFGDKLDPQAAPQPVVAQPAPAPVPVVAPPPQPEQKPTQVTIEKVEIVQPEKDKPVVEPAPLVPAAEIKANVDEDKEAKPAPKFYIGGIVGVPEYNASNVKTNYGLGVTVGTMIDEHNAIELSFLYSNYLIDTFWKYGLYNELTQYDVQAAYKFYILSGPLKPYVGGSATYISRNYQDRIKNGAYYTPYNQSLDSEQTNAVDVGVLAGVDYVISERFIIGAGVDYNHNVMNSRNNFTSEYNLDPQDTKALEDIDFYTFKLNAKLSF